MMCKLQSIQTTQLIQKIIAVALLLSSSIFCYAIDISEDHADKEDLLGIIESDLLSTNEPIYFVLGGHHEFKAHFQFSFKYRLLDEESRVVSAFPLLKDLYLAYSQTSLWNLDSDSYPFEDSSYRPGWFIDHHVKNDAPLLPSFVRAGYEHESNGKEAEASRTRGTFFVWPFWSQTLAGHNFVIAPKLYGYTSKDDENPDIADYRSYVDLLLRYGGEQHWSMSTTYRFSKENYSGTFVEFSQPLRKSRDGSTGGYLYVQLFEGYGETLLAYNEQRDIQLRFGFAIVR